MAAPEFRLRAYQVEVLDQLAAYLRKAQTLGAGAAFYDRTKLPYTEAPFLDPETPYVCIRIPTGGGKTVVAAHSVGIVAREHLQCDNPMVLWLVPSTAILDQTLAALRKLDQATGSVAPVSGSPPAASAPLRKGDAADGPAAMQKVLERHVRAHLDELAEVRPDFR